LSNLLFLEINTRCSKTNFFPEKKQSRPVMPRGFSHAHMMHSGPREGEEDLPPPGCQSFPLKSGPFTLSRQWEGTCCHGGEGSRE